MKNDPADEKSYLRDLYSRPKPAPSDDILCSYCKKVHKHWQQCAEGLDYFEGITGE